MQLNYPLHFKPLFRRYLWGGHRLESLLGKAIGDETCAESWEIVDHGEDQSIVINGPLAGTSLEELVRDHANDLFGKNVPTGRFPLLFKFLDAHRTLSVQVHPNDEQGAKLSPPDFGKTEAWVVLAAEPGSKIYAGLKPGVDREILEKSVRNGTCEDCLHAFEANVGDCVFIPAGVIHALGEGLVIAEIQQASDTTFRLFDWNRVDKDGQPRDLHIEEALNVTDFAIGPVHPVRPMPLLMDAQGEATAERLVACDKFVMDRMVFEAETSTTIATQNQFVLLVVLEGEVEVSGEHQESTLQKGGTTLVPAAVGSVEIQAKRQSTLLRITC